MNAESIRKLYRFIPQTHHVHIQNTHCHSIKPIKHFCHGFYLLSVCCLGLKIIPAKVSTAPSCPE